MRIFGKVRIAQPLGVKSLPGSFMQMLRRREESTKACGGRRKALSLPINTDWVPLEERSQTNTKVCHPAPNPAAGPKGKHG